MLARLIDRLVRAINGLDDRVLFLITFAVLVAYVTAPLWVTPR